MVSMLVNLIIGTALFYGLSKALPGFQIKDEKAALKVAAVYGVLVTLAVLLLLTPALTVVGALLAIVYAVPLLGPLLVKLAWLPLRLTVFALSFVISVIVIKVTDALLEEFKCDSWNTAAIAAGGLALGGTVARTLLGM